MILRSWKAAGMQILQDLTSNGSQHNNQRQNLPGWNVLTHCLIASFYARLWKNQESFDLLPTKRAFEHKKLSQNFTINPDCDLCKRFLLKFVQNAGKLVLLLLFSLVEFHYKLSPQNHQRSLQKRFNSSFYYHCQISF